MFQFELVLNDVKDAVVDRSGITQPRLAIVDHAWGDYVLLTALDDKHGRLLRIIAHTLIVILIILLVHSRRILPRLLALKQCHIVNFLIGNGLGIR